MAVMWEGYVLTDGLDSDCRALICLLAAASARPGWPALTHLARTPGRPAGQSAGPVCIGQLCCSRRAACYVHV